ncbi:hypothetical protein [Planktothricoides raciborskii]|uniref:Transposase n=1 Tax=Planktothricoides raciborskii GIHE-MW2 TaxID=2792601 RepID=A0AAU8JBP5_9CYAN
MAIRPYNAENINVRAKHSGSQINSFSTELLPECFAPTECFALAWFGNQKTAVIWIYVRAKHDRSQINRFSNKLSAVMLRPYNIFSSRGFSVAVVAPICGHAKAPTVEPNSAEPKRLPGLVPLRSNSAAIAFRI